MSHTQNLTVSSDDLNVSKQDVVSLPDKSVGEEKLKTFKVVPYEEKYLGQMMDVLRLVRAADPSYPPASDVPDISKSLKPWLFNAETVGRSLILCGDQVAGHVAVMTPRPYMTKFLESSPTHFDAANFLEIVKLYINPTFQGLGVGSILFNDVCKQIETLGKIPSLSVVQTSFSARKMYAKNNMLELGTFDGRHGVNHVFARINPA